VIDVERIDFVSFLTQDIQRSKRFYTELLGLEVEGEGEYDMELRAGQVTLAIVVHRGAGADSVPFSVKRKYPDIFDPSRAGQPFAPSPAGLALRVPDVAAARAELEAKGVEFQGETHDTGVCHMAFFKDPDGNALMLHRRYAPND
jgi:catechol 2,3-dioxygenase-like lactoylglutathione lyase family enzyme